MRSWHGQRECGGDSMEARKLQAGRLTDDPATSGRRAGLEILLG